MKKSTFILLAVALSSCSPKVITSFQKTYPPILDSPSQVVVVENSGMQGVSSNTELLGTVKINDSGFTKSSEGTFEKVVDLSRYEAWQAGGNLLVIKEHQKPDFYSSIHRINSLVFRADSSFLSTVNSITKKSDSYISPSPSLQQVTINQKPAFVAVGSIGAGFRTNKTNENLNSSERYHFKKLKRGLDINLNLNYFFKNGNGIGLVYDRYSANSKDYGSLQKEDGTSELGYLNTTLDLDFVGLMWSVRGFTANQKHTFITQVGLGPVFYDSKDTFNSISDHMEGSAFGLFYSLIYGYNVTDHFALGGEIKYLMANMFQVSHTNQNGVVTVEDLRSRGVAEGLNTLGLFVSATYTF